MPARSLSEETPKVVGIRYLFHRVHASCSVVVLENDDIRPPSGTLKLLDTPHQAASFQWEKLVYGESRQGRWYTILFRAQIWRSYL